MTCFTTFAHCPEDLSDFPDVFNFKTKQPTEKKSLELETTRIKPSTQYHIAADKTDHYCMTALTIACCYCITKLPVLAEDKQQTNPLETITKSCFKESGKKVIEESIPVTPAKQSLEQRGMVYRQMIGVQIN
jgi:hypothetical protein